MKLNKKGGGITLSYLLCIECALLLDVMEKMEGNYADKYGNNRE